MKLHAITVLDTFTVIAFACVYLVGFVNAEELVKWDVPLGGNAYLTDKSVNSSDKVEATGVTGWSDVKSVFSIYFQVDRAAVVDLALRLKVPEGESAIRVMAGGLVFDKKGSLR